MDLQDVPLSTLFDDRIKVHENERTVATDQLTFLEKKGTSFLARGQGSNPEHRSRRKKPHQLSEEKSRRVVQIMRGAIVLGMLIGSPYPAP